MNLHRFASVMLAVLALSISGCGFHPRKEAQLPANMQRIHIQIADSTSPLAKSLARALPRSGAQVVDKDEPDATQMKITANNFFTDVLAVGGAARAVEYALRYHVEFEVTDAAGIALLPKQTIELTRTFTFDQSQALGVSAETDLLTQELQKDMVQTILRRLEALTKAHPAAAHP
ncbi:MAG: LPS assembly lipoprotein LptE [Rhodanobacter sp.]|jgi:LPS-assembly lipoprotein|nr:LPS assembly lipoprotein LptE [Rhodanobacter sp.]